MTAPRVFSLNGRLSIIMLLSVALAAGCGGGGGSSMNQGTTAGPAAVGVSVTQTSSADAALFAAAASGTVSVPDAELMRASDFPTLEHVWVSVTKIALMPVEGERPDGDGEEFVEDHDGDLERETGEHSPFVVLVPPPGTRIDLLNPPGARQLARFLNKFESVPAGTYGKIRVYYSRIVADLAGGRTVAFHPTAHYHFDFHFVGGPLVIPATTDTAAPDGWIRFFRVEIKIVGLKIKVIGPHDWDRDDWNPRGQNGKLKIILRPQVFARFVPPILYSIGGTAQKVAPGGFSIAFDAKAFNVLYDPGTTWAFSDNIFAGGRIVDVSPDRGILALRNGALVEAVGLFPPGSPDLAADNVYIMFPDVLTGKVFGGWAPDNTFSLRRPADNVVFPQPGRFTAIYDNATSFAPLGQGAIVDNAVVTARGYARTAGGVPVGVEAFWISIGP